MAEITIKSSKSIWTWKAKYSDGTDLPQFSQDGAENSYKNIDRSKLEYFELYDEGILKFSIKLHEGQKLIFRRRTFIDMSGNSKGRIYLVGYHYKDGGGNSHKVINYIHESGLIELDDDRQDLVQHPEES